MAASIILRQPVAEKVIRHSLNNSFMAIDKLAQQLTSRGYHFHRDQNIGNYTFDFYCPKYKLAIEVDTYAHEYDDIYNKDDFKFLKIHSLNITVLRVTDYQILIDTDEIFRHIKRYTDNYTDTSYLV
ncbi:endonuclease domain-containing protein [Aquimarina rhabdastrellae]